MLLERATTSSMGSNVALSVKMGSDWPLLHSMYSPDQLQERLSRSPALRRMLNTFSTPSPMTAARGEDKTPVSKYQKGTDSATRTRPRLGSASVERCSSIASVKRSLLEQHDQVATSIQKSLETDSKNKRGSGGASSSPRLPPDQHIQSVQVVSNGVDPRSPAGQTCQPASGRKPGRRLARGAFADKQTKSKSGAGNSGQTRLARHKPAHMMPVSRHNDEYAQAMAAAKAELEKSMAKYRRPEPLTCALKRVPGETKAPLRQRSVNSLNAAPNYM